MGLLRRAASMAGTRQVAAAAEPSIWEELLKYGKDRAGFQGIVLSPPEDTNTGSAAFTNQVSAMVHSFGTALPLASSGSLILFDSAKDRELICHRITKTLGVRALFNFAADSPKAAYQLIQPYL
jgi:hypothetical protein